MVVTGFERILATEGGKTGLGKFSNYGDIPPSSPDCLSEAIRDCTG